MCFPAARKTPQDVLLKFSLFLQAMLRRSQVLKTKIDASGWLNLSVKLSLEETVSAQQIFFGRETVKEAVAECSVCLLLLRLSRNVCGIRPNIPRPVSRQRRRINQQITALYIYHLYHWSGRQEGTGVCFCFFMPRQTTLSFALYRLYLPRTVAMLLRKLVTYSLDSKSATLSLCVCPCVCVPGGGGGGGNA